MIGLILGLVFLGWVGTHEANVHDYDWKTVCDATNGTWVEDNLAVGKCNYDKE